MLCEKGAEIGLEREREREMFGRTINPISTRGADYAHHINTSPPKFLDLATALSRTPFLHFSRNEVAE